MYGMHVGPRALRGSLAVTAGDEWCRSSTQRAVGPRCCHCLWVSSFNRRLGRYLVREISAQQRHDLLPAQWAAGAAVEDGLGAFLAIWRRHSEQNVCPHTVSSIGAWFSDSRSKHTGH